MAAPNDLVKRLVLGRALRSDRLGEQLLPKKIALPVFASDALSSVAYAPDEIFLTLALAGVAAYTFSWKIALVVAVVMLTVIISYRQNVHAYPSGGGDYEVATVNLGATAGLTVASALLVDYVLTVAVSISSAAQYAASAIPVLAGHEATTAVFATVFLMTMNLRGVKESGVAFAVPTYVFMAAILGMTAFGLLRYAFGDLPQAESADLAIAAQPPYEQGISGLAGAFLLLRAFSSGCAALTGVEAISNGVPAFAKPKSKNAATTLGLLGLIAITMVLGVITLANLMDLRFAEDPATELLRDGVPVGESYAAGAGDRPAGPRRSSTASRSASTWSPRRPGSSWCWPPTPPSTASRCSGRSWPGTATCRASCTPAATGWRTATGSSLLAGAAIVLIWAFDAQVTRLIQLYIVGVFLSFTLSQAGMFRHWTRLLAAERRPAERAPDAPAARDQRLRPDDDRFGAGDRAGHEVHPRGLHRASSRWRCCSC